MPDQLRDQLQTALGDTYRIERELGGGGMSRVFVAREASLNRDVVVKVLPPELVAGVNVERFKREIQLAAQLQHPHVVPVLSTGEMDGLPYYTMPLVRGESLRARLAQQAMLPISEAMSILRDVAKALSFAHEQGVVHRDIKPDNVLLAGGSAVVTDFGIAKALAASRRDDDFPGRTSGALTAMGTSIGTPTYMAPEQAAGDPATDHRADIYAFGCMAYEMLAGKPPFVASSPQKLLASHMAEVARPVQDLRLDTPALLAELVKKCLSKVAPDRPQNAAEISRVLDAVATGSASDRAVPAVLLGGRVKLGRALAVYAAAYIVVAIIAKAAIIGVGLPDWVLPGALIVMGLGLPVILFTAYVHYEARRTLTRTPTLTPGGGTAWTGTMSTIALKASPHVSWRRTTWGGALAVGGFVLLIGGYMLLRALGIGPAGSLLAAGVIGANERLVVADFQGRTSDTTLGPVITEAFRTGLAESQSVSVMPPATVREVIRRMQRPFNGHVDFALAREVATREGLKAVVDGEILGVGGSYKITTRLMTLQSDEPLASFTETASAAKDILPAVDKLAKRMRARIGESLKRVQAAPALEQVTTPSLDALRKYVQGARLLESGGDFIKGTTLLEEAIALDTGFAMAYRKLGVELANRGGNDARASDLLQKAFNHRDRLSDAERYLTEGTYYMLGPKQDAVKAMSAFESLIELQPTTSAGLNNASELARDLRDMAKAEDYGKRAIATGLNAGVFYQNTALAQFALGKADSGGATVRQYVARQPQSALANLYLAATYSAADRYDSAQAVLTPFFRDHLKDPASTQPISNSLAQIGEAQGHLREYLRWMGETRRAGMQRGIAVAPLQALLDSAYVVAWYYRDTVRAGRMIDAALAAHPLESLAEAERPYGRVENLYSMVKQPQKARAILATFEKGRARYSTLADEAVMHVMRGDIAFAEGKYDLAVQEYRAGDQGPCLICILPKLARAYDLAGRSDSALAVFTRYVDTPDLTRITVDNAYLAGTYKRLGELWEAKGDRTKAAAYYARFIDLWKTADPELQPTVIDVRKRLSRLGDGEKR